MSAGGAELRAELLACYVAVAKAEKAVGETEARTEARWDAVVTLSKAEAALTKTKTKVRCLFGLAPAIPIIRACREQAEENSR